VLGGIHYRFDSDVGLEIARDVTRLALDMERRLFASLSASELKDFKALLARITARVTELESAAAPKELTR